MSTDLLADNIEHPFSQPETYRLLKSQRISSAVDVGQNVPQQCDSPHFSRYVFLLSVLPNTHYRLDSLSSFQPFCIAAWLEMPTLVNILLKWPFSCPLIVSARELCWIATTLLLLHRTFSTSTLASDCKPVRLQSELAPSISERMCQPWWPWPTSLLTRATIGSPWRIISQCWGWERILYFLFQMHFIF